MESITIDLRWKGTEFYGQVGEMTKRVEADPMAECPWCKGIVLMDHDLNQIGSCPHYSHAEKQDGKVFAVFER